MKIRTSVIVYLYIILYGTLLYFDKMMNLEWLTTGLLMIVGSYTGLGVFLAMQETKKLPAGVVSKRNEKKVLTIIIFLLAIMGIAYFRNDKYLNEISGAFVISVVAYISDRKTKQTVKNKTQK